MSRVFRRHLANKEHLMAAACDRFPDQMLTLTCGVALCSIDQAHTEIDTNIQRGDLALPGAHITSHARGSLSEYRDLVNGGKANVRDSAHCISTSTSRSDSLASTS